jgi:uncharacterized NAD-dependent epimerase/dehydratase family protein
VLGDPTGPGRGVPVVADLRAALGHDPDTLLIGIAPAGGRLPPEWRDQILAAIRAGLDVVSGLHEFLADDPELAAAARERGVRLWDVRRPPAGLAARVAEGLPHRRGSHVVHLAGTDCNVGKMTVALELHREAVRRGLSSGFAATGQTGIIIAGGGIPADHVISDFLAGATEGLVLEEAERHDWVFVEGQGSLLHAAFSAVTLGLLHGSAPDLMVLCHDARRTTVRHIGTPIPPLASVRRMYEQAAAWLKPAPVVAVALNTFGLDEASARAAIARAQDEIGLPATDPVRFGPGPLLDALLASV